MDFNLDSLVYFFTGAYEITVFIPRHLSSITWSLIQWTLSFWLGALKLLTSPLTAALHAVAFILSPVGYLVQFMLAPIFAITAIAIKLEVCLS